MQSTVLGAFTSQQIYEVGTVFNLHFMDKEPETQSS